MAFYCNGKMGVCEYNKEDRNCAECAYLDGTGGREIPDAPKPQTNADRIRAMSDEELADALMRFVKGLVESEGRVVAFEEGFREELLHQLQQPVKDGDNE